MVFIKTMMREVMMKLRSDYRSRMYSQTISTLPRPICRIMTIFSNSILERKLRISNAYSICLTKKNQGRLILSISKLF